MKFSIIITTKDRPQELLASVLSLVSQTFKVYELIIYVDDYLYKYQQTLDKIRKILPPGNLKIIGGFPIGRAFALNQAHKHVSEDVDFIGLLDDDDRLHPFCLAEINKVLTRNPQLEIVYTGLFNVRNNTVSESRLNSIPFSIENIKQKSILFHFVAYSKALYQKAGNTIDTTVLTAVDFALYIRLLTFATIQPHQIPTPLYFYSNNRTNRISITHYQEQQRSFANSVKKYGDKIKF